MHFCPALNPAGGYITALFITCSMIPSEMCLSPVTTPNPRTQGGVIVGCGGQYTYPCWYHPLPRRRATALAGPRGGRCRRSRSTTRGASLSTPGVVFLPLFFFFCAIPSHGTAFYWLARSCGRLFRNVRSIGLTQEVNFPSSFSLPRILHPNIIIQYSPCSMPPTIVDPPSC